MAMALFIKTDKDPAGTLVRVEAGFRGKDGKHYLILHRLPPHYSKPPTFVVELSAEAIDYRGEEARTYYKAFAIQDFSEKEMKLLVGAKPGQEQTPFFNFSYAAAIRRFGKTFYKLTDQELSQIVGTERYWKLVGGLR